MPVLLLDDCVTEITQVISGEGHLEAILGDCMLVREFSCVVTVFYLNRSAVISDDLNFN